MKLFGYIKSKISKDENVENVPYLEITEVVLIHCDVVNNSYQLNSIIFYIFVTNKSYGQLFSVSPKDFIFSKAQNFHILKCGLQINILNL